MDVRDFHYELPKELIAQRPLLNRDASRLMVMNRKTGAIAHHVFTDIEDMLYPGDCLVINDTKVIPARLLGERPDTGAKVEVLLLKQVETGLWECLVKPGKKMKAGDRAVFGKGIMECKIKDVLPSGNRLAEFLYEGVFEERLDQLGEMPLPPYITEKLKDKSRYQTVYAQYDGSAAAPTAGLHFTKELMERLEKKGVLIGKITLHVGLGTFRPVKGNTLEEHQMHSEYYHIDPEQAQKINKAKADGGRIIAVGTTSCRTLESNGEKGVLSPGHGHTDIFIYPGYRFQMIDGLITNFHLPESTLIMLVSAFCGRVNTLTAYQEAVKEKYRFFSFGDAMFIR